MSLNSGATEGSSDFVLLSTPRIQAWLCFLAGELELAMLYYVLFG
jgi:hypothetical protein